MAVSRRSIARAGLLVLLHAAVGSRAWAQVPSNPVSTPPAPLDFVVAAPTTSAQPADPAEAETETPPPVVFVDHSAPRVRFGIMTGHQLNLGWCVNRYGSAYPGTGLCSFMVGAVGLTLDLGVQFNDHLALYAHAGASSTLILWSAGFVYLMGEWTPTRKLSIGSGIGWEGALDGLPLLGWGWWQGISVPLTVAWNLGKVDRTSAHRSMFRIGIEGAISYGLFWDSWADTAKSLGVHFGYWIGWAWM